MSYNKLVEKYKSEDYCLTFTLSPYWIEGCSVEDAQDQYERSYPVLEALLNSLGGETIYTIELTKKGVIHYHAYLLYPYDTIVRKVRLQIKKWLEMYDDNHMFGYYDVKTCYDRDNWLAYMHKSELISTDDC